MMGPCEHNCIYFALEITNIAAKLLMLTFA